MHVKVGMDEASDKAAFFDLELWLGCMLKGKGKGVNIHPFPFSLSPLTERY
jgi:hypothetical protein